MQISNRDNCTKQNFMLSFVLSNKKTMALNVIHEDNHTLVVSKNGGDIVQGDKTGDRTLIDDVKAYIKEKYNKPGEVFCGLVHRLDRPTSGAVLFARTSKALSRLSAQFKERTVAKTYWAIVEKMPAQKEATLIHFLKKNEKQNKSYAHKNEVNGSKRAELSYKHLASSDKYHLLEVSLKTGRHHQIRTQLATIGCIIKGDLKYGAKRSNKDGSISLHARNLAYNHPTTKERIDLTAPCPKDPLWQFFEGA